LRPKQKTDPERARRFWQAGLIYGALGLAIMALALGDPQMLRPERRADLARLLIGLPIFALLAVSVAYGDRALALILRGFGTGGQRARRIGEAIQRWLVRLLTLSASVRFLIFLTHALGFRLTLGGFESIPMSSAVSKWLPAAMMSAIVLMLVRAGWYRARPDAPEGTAADCYDEPMTNELSFDVDVLKRSHNLPVVVDFWAPWCGPCRILGPIIEQLAGEAEGRWELVKLDTEEHPKLAARHEIRGIPAVKMFVGGEVIAEFVGALSADEIREWLADNLPAQES